MITSGTCRIGNHDLCKNQSCECGCHSKLIRSATNNIEKIGVYRRKTRALVNKYLCNKEFPTLDLFISEITLMLIKESILNVRFYIINIL